LSIASTTFFLSTISFFLVGFGPSLSRLSLKGFLDLFARTRSVFIFRPVPPSRRFRRKLFCSACRGLSTTPPLTNIQTTHARRDDSSAACGNRCTPLFLSFLPLYVLILWSYSTPRDTSRPTTELAVLLVSLVAKLIPPESLFRLYPPSLELSGYSVVGRFRA